MTKETAEKIRGMSLEDYRERWNPVRVPELFPDATGEARTAAENVLRTIYNLPDDQLASVKHDQENKFS